MITSSVFFLMVPGVLLLEGAPNTFPVFSYPLETNEQEEAFLSVQNTVEVLPSSLPQNLEAVSSLPFYSHILSVLLDFISMGPTHKGDLDHGFSIENLKNPRIHSS